MKKLMLLVVLCTVAGSVPGAVTNVTEDVKLTADADWRGQGVVKIAEGVNIDLDGHELKTDGFTADAFELVDATDADRTAHPVTGASLYSGDVEFLFDNNIRYTADAGAPSDKTRNHRIIKASVSTNNAFWVTYDFAEPTCLCAYRIHYNCSASGNERAPVDWTFQGSNDNSNWTTLDTHTGETNWRKPDVRLFRFGNARYYRFYRLRVTKPGVNGGYLEMYQLEYFKTPAGQTDITTPTNAVTAVPADYYSGDVAFLFDDEFRYSSDSTVPKDKTQNHRLCVQNVNPSTPFGIVYDFGAPTNVNAVKVHYTCVPGYGNDRAPRDWKFLGSNDSETWTTVYEHANDNNWTRSCSRLFSFANSQAFRYYKFEVSKVVSSSVLELCQLEYFRRPQIVSPVSDEDVTSPGGTVSTSRNPLYGSVANLFDNNFTYSGPSGGNHRIIADSMKFPSGGSKNFAWTYDFGAAEGNWRMITAYRCYYNASNSNRSPRHWQFSGSIDGNNWTLLDEHQGENWAEGAIRRFDFVNTTKYRYYKFDVLESNSSYVEMYQMEYFEGLGTVVAEIEQGAVVTNTALVAGTVRFVKSGAGEFVDDCADQDTMGTLELNGGVYRAIWDGSWTTSPLVLGGGTLSLDFRGPNATPSAFSDITLTADSIFRSCKPRVNIDNNNGGRIDLGGHKLTFEIPAGSDLYVGSSAITNGTIAVSGEPSAWFYFNQNAALDCSTVSFDFNCGYRMYLTPVTAQDLTVRATNTVATGKAMTVKGRFRPIVAGFQDTVLADGATLDLTGFDGTLPVKSEKIDKYLSFAADATITVDLGGVRRPSGACLVSWDAGHKPPQSVTFALDSATQALKCRLEVREDGLYVRTSGILIIVK